MKIVRFSTWKQQQRTRYGLLEDGIVYPLAGNLMDKPIRQGLRYPLKCVHLLCPVEAVSYTHLARFTLAANLK